MGSGKTLTEVEVDLQLTGLRAAQEGFLEPSFATIAGGCMFSRKAIESLLDCGLVFFIQSSTLFVMDASHNKVSLEHTT